MSDTMTLEQIKAGGDIILNRDSSFDIAEYGDGGVVGGVSSRGRQAWHGLLEVRAKELLTIDDVREAYAPLFLPIHKEPLNHWGRPVPGKFAIVRSDGKVLGIVGRRYHEYAFEKVAEFGQTILDTGEANIETAVSTNNEASFFLVMKLSRELKIAGLEHEMLDLYLLLSNSLDGSSKFRAAITPVRVECTNSENFALKHAPRMYEIVHTSSIEGRVLDARAALGISYAYVDAVADIGTKLLGQKMRGSDFSAFLNRLVPLPPLPEGKDSTRVRTNRENVRSMIRFLYAEDDHTANIRGTRWAALQAVTKYHDHHQGRRKTETSSADESRFNAIVEPNADNLPNRALALLV